MCILISVLLRCVYGMTTYSPFSPKIPDYFRRFSNTTEDFRRLQKMSEDIPRYVCPTKSTKILTNA